MRVLEGHDSLHSNMHAYWIFDNVHIPSAFMLLCRQDFSYHYHLLKYHALEMGAVLWRLVVCCTESLHNVLETDLVLKPKTYIWILALTLPLLDKLFTFTHSHFRTSYLHSLRLSFLTYKLEIIHPTLLLQCLNKYNTEKFLSHENWATSFQLHSIYLLASVTTIKVVHLIGRVHNNWHLFCARHCYQ